ncbi:flagellar basal body-associated protein FliL [Alloalcanivorax sp. C16-1]|uniref:flagellar basal body-associated protein FliL n=1 Tax=Alloalcanivorax sp. C16-1 TaxID=3390051 RepID=UPI0039709E63
MAESGNRSRKVGVLITLIAVLVAALGAATFFLLFDDQEPPANRTAQVSAAPAPARFVKLEPFTVNVQGDLCGQRLLYVGLTLQVGDEKTEQYLLDNIPPLRSRLLMLLSSQNAETAATLDGKRELARQVTAMFEEPLTASQPELAVQDVLFTEFIVQ